MVQPPITDYRQPIAINFDVLNSLFDQMDSDLATGLSKFSALTTKLKNFHTIFSSVDSGDSIAWRRLVNELKLRHNSYSDIIEALLSPRNLRIEPVFPPANAELNSKEWIIELTPDRLYLKCNNEKLCLRGANCYDLNKFLTENFRSGCVLFRIPKVIELKASTEFSNFDWFGPYIRESVKIEYCDPWIFRRAERDSESDWEDKTLKGLGFLAKILNKCKKIEVLTIKHKYESEIKEQFLKALLKRLDFKVFLKKSVPTLKEIVIDKYNGSKNHDRFILVDKDRFTIRITTSENNFFETNKNSISIRNGTAFYFNSGRSYED